MQVFLLLRVLKLVCQVHPQDVNSICHLIVHNKTIETLRFCNVGFEADHMERIAVALGQNRTITHFACYGVWENGDQTFLFTESCRVQHSDSSAARDCERCDCSQSASHCGARARNRIPAERFHSSKKNCKPAECLSELFLFFPSPC